MFFVPSNKNSGCYGNLYYMGKVEIDHFSFSLGTFGLFCFTEMFIEYSSTFHMTFVQISEFDWLSGRLKGSIFVKMFKYRLLRNHKG